ncbi:HD domain-containing protein [Candidatus Bodocaedibacter vickermanii]|uniref:Bifunctional (P)ppGpp synthase/hydrolase RelA n=1 Tax=Candidatus Bodocaedibacter vickermanii TaxID=2741701 RepID=A0A7L9RSC5_9PROT|nr:Bifunctional (p)ppGpp synthase/hydrolase RelA [Candidatus Paracaedibacteraceae bacterium 'Lake Konstanz']
MAWHIDWESKFKSCDYSDKLLEKINRFSAEANTSVDVHLVKKAIYFAKEYHFGQFRQSGEPYYTHPLEVAGMVCDYLVDTVSIITSILHDTLEDTDLDYATIAEHFGDLVAAQVEDLTRVKPFGKITSADILKQLWKEKKYNLLLIKLVDRLHNMQTIFAKSPEKQHKIVTETLQYFLALSEILELPELTKVLYTTCYETNIKLGLIPQDELILDKPVEFADSLISESN